METEVCEFKRQEAREEGKWERSDTSMLIVKNCGQIQELRLLGQHPSNKDESRSKNGVT